MGNKIIITLALVGFVTLAVMVGVYLGDSKETNNDMVYYSNAECLIVTDSGEKFLIYENESNNYDWVILNCGEYTMEKMTSTHCPGFCVWINYSRRPDLGGDIPEGEIDKIKIRLSFDNGTTWEDWSESEPSPLTDSEVKAEE